MRPDAYAIIIGAMKCGTTTLYQYLARHPQMCRCVTKEPEFFSERQAHKRRGVQRYEDLWRFDAARHRYAVEASTGYTKWPEETGVADRMFAYGIRPKLIYLVRNPFERIESDFNYSIDGWWFQEDEPITSGHYTLFSKYFTQLEHFRERFGKDQILVLDFAELRTHPERILSRVSRFLDISPFEQAPHLHVRPSASLRSRLRKRLLPWLTSQRRRLTGAERELIRNVLYEDMVSLEREYGIDVSQWGFGNKEKQITL